MSYLRNPPPGGGVRRGPGSLRDPDSRIFYVEGSVYRALSDRGLADWEAFAASRVHGLATGMGAIVASERVDPALLPADLVGAAAAVLRHERVPFISYPYEWPFAMLKDATLLQLHLLREALAESLVLKDSTPYNVQWRGAHPVFIDVGSFGRLEEGAPWAAYDEFCRLFLYPLMLDAYKGIRYPPLLRGSIEGIEPAQAWAMMSSRDLLRRGVLRHVYLHARRGRSGRRRRSLQATVARLESLVRALEPKGHRPAPARAGDPDAAQRERFVAACAASGDFPLVWDLGCGDGRYTRIAAAQADYAVAIDADPAVAAALYARLREEGITRILPLAMDVAEPSPGLGWRGLERRRLEDRGRPDLTLCLALVHRLVIARNVAVAELLAWLASLGSALLVEFRTREDETVRPLLAELPAGGCADYRLDWFERCLGERFTVEGREPLESGTRFLFFARPRAGAAG